MGRRRTWSWPRRLDFGLVQTLLAEAGAEIGGWAQVDFGRREAFRQRSVRWRRRAAARGCGPARIRRSGRCRGRVSASRRRAEPKTAGRPMPCCWQKVVDFRSALAWVPIPGGRLLRFLAAALEEGHSPPAKSEGEGGGRLELFDRLPPVISVAVDRKDEARDKVYNAAVERVGAGTD